MPSLKSRRQPPTTQDFTSPVHHTRVVARLGLWLRAAFLICFLPGLISHLHQQPIAWLPIPPAPAWAYRPTQGLHVATGVACVPLLLAKMLTVFAVLPRRLRPPMRVAALAGATVVLIGVPLLMTR